jgi:CRP/FNR family transcriptional regulator
MQHTVTNLSPIKVTCPDCRLNRICLPHGLDPKEIEQLDGIVKRNKPLQRGDLFYAQGDAMRSLFVILSGSAKSYITASDGTEQIVGFYFPGELMGLDALEHHRHNSTAMALEKTVLCELPFTRFEDLCAKIPHLNHEMFSLYSKELTHEQEMLLLMGQRDVDQRLAVFLLNLSARFKARGYSSSDFFLSMSRYDIANFLGIAPETVSRSFSQFEKRGLLHVDGKKVCLYDRDRLRVLAYPGERAVPVAVNT